MQDNLFAAIDLGSNSFRLEIGRFDSGHYQRVEYFKEAIRQGSGLDSERNLSATALNAGWDCLARFAERLQSFRPEQVRAVATQTLREARNREAFLTKGQRVLGFPIELISGTEEARLIFQGVDYFLPRDNSKRFVIDIGGRSTELILGSKGKIHEAESYRVGSVAWSARFFPNGELTSKHFHHAQIAAKAVLEEACQTYRKERWELAYGSSGTVGAVTDALSANGLRADVIDLESLQWLTKQLIRAGNASSLSLEGLKEDRKAVFAGGLSILQAAMELFGIEQLVPAAGALRHGVIIDVADHSLEDDIREQSVTRLATMFGVDKEQAERVSSVCKTLATEVFENYSGNAKYLIRKLRWASWLLEIGMIISHSDYHKHSGYVVQNADVIGFNIPELERLSLLVLGHKGKLKKLGDSLNDWETSTLLIVIRLASILCHARQAPELRGVSLKFDGARDTYVLNLTEKWAEKYPLSLHLIEQEVISWERSKWGLILVVT